VNILLVSQYFWPESFVVNDLVSAWQERGHRVTVLTGIPNYPTGTPFPGYSALDPREERFGTSRVVRVPLVPRGGGSRARMAANYLSFAASASLLGPLRCREAVDVVFVFQTSPATVGLPATLLARARRAPLVWWIQDLWPESLSAARATRSPLMLAAVGRLMRWLYRRCDLLLVQSEGFLVPLARHGVREERVRFLPNWAQPWYRPIGIAADSEERRSLPPGFVILFAGNLGEVQSLETVLAAAERVDAAAGIHWVLMGEGRRRRWLESEIARRGLAGSVHLLAARPAAAMPRWLGAADALLLTLRADPTLALTVPSKLQSYLACGRPILAALDGVPAEVVRRAGAGRVGPAEDAATLAANAIALANATSEERAVMGRAGRAFQCAHYDRERLLDRLDGWLSELVAASPA
jgi:glycosyltransferase involved in cell wall biosynthesis